jgi:hypothetical protein
VWRARLVTARACDSANDSVRPPRFAPRTDDQGCRADVWRRDIRGSSDEDQDQERDEKAAAHEENSTVGTPQYSAILNQQFRANESSFCNQPSAMLESIECLHRN